MVTYRLIGGDIDVFLDTDATTTDGGVAEEFFITDIRGNDPIDIRSGFDIGINYYNEGQLINFARENDIELYSFDDQRQERCVVMQLSGTPAGRFNGQTSRLLFNPGFSLSSGGNIQLPLVFEFTFRVTEADFEAIVDTGDVYQLMSTDLDADDYFSLFVSNLGDENELTISLDGTVDGGKPFVDEVTIVNPVDRCLDVRLEVRLEGEEILFELSVNNEMSDVGPSIEGSTISVTTDPFKFIFGASITVDEIETFFLGIMRNIVVSAGGTELINVTDPSTGVNSAGTNGVATDVESVSVIM